MKTGTLNAAHAHRAERITSRSGNDHCPTTTVRHRARDGEIVRLRLPGGRLTPAAARVVAEHAAPGDAIEVTSRANLQLRGLQPAGAERAAAAFADAGLVPSAAHERGRTIVASPLIGRRGTPLGDEFVRELDAAICARQDTTALSGRILTVIDDGRAHPLSDAADVVVRWDAATGAVALRVGGLPAGSIDGGGAAAATSALLGALASACAEAGVWRARELPHHALARLAEDARTRGVRTLAAHDPADGHGGDGDQAAEPMPVGTIAQADGRAAVRAVLPLGRLDAPTLRAVARLAETADTDLRFDHERGVTLVDLAPPHAAARAEQLAALGLIVAAHDPAVGLTACAGWDCQRCDVDVRGAARLRLSQRRAAGGTPVREHLVGCERRCGAPLDGTTVTAQPADTAASLAARAAAATIALSANHTLPTSPTGLEAAR